MEKQVNKSKIILISIAILIAILSFSIGIFGIINRNKIKEKDEDFVDAATNYYLYDNNTFYFNGLTIYTNAKQYSSGTTVGNNKVTFDVGGWYDITSASATRCEVTSDAGINLFNSFKAAGSFTVSDSRHIIVYKWPNREDSFEEKSAHSIDFKLKSFNFYRGTISVAYGETYQLSRGDGITTYRYNGNDVLSIISGQVTIKSSQGLKLYSHLVREGTVRYLDVNIAGYTVDLTADLDMSGYSMPVIGSIGNHFSGKFYGNGHTISNLNVTDSNATFNDYTAPAYGLFGYTTGATISNLYLKNIKITASSYHVSGYKAGGLIGVANNTTIENCIVDATIQDWQAIALYSPHSLGGIVGYIENTNVTVNKCLADIDFEIYSANDGMEELSIGGIIGEVWTGATLTVESSCSVISVQRVGACSAGEIHFGGIAGWTAGNLKVYLSIMQIDQFDKTVALMCDAYILSDNVYDFGNNMHYINSGKVGIEITTGGSSDYGKPIN